MSARTADSSAAKRAASPSRLATTSASSSWPRSRCSARRRSTMTAPTPRLRSRSCSTRRRRSLTSSAPRAASSALAAATSVSRRASVDFSSCSFAAASSFVVAERGQLRAQAGDLATGDVDPQRRQLADQVAVTAGRLGLALQRPQLAADLAQQVLDAQQAGLGGVEPALGLLLALAELEDAGGLLDDRPALLGAGVEDGVDLALADDDVLLAADAGVRQQLLDVEQAARHVVDGVLAVAAAEQRAADRDLGELDRAGCRRSCRA